MGITITSGSGLSHRSRQYYYCKEDRAATAAIGHESQCRQDDEDPNDQRSDTGENDDDNDDRPGHKAAN